MAHSQNAHHDAHGHDDGHAHGSLRDYITGFVLAVILTVIPFWLVMSGGFESRSATVAVVMICAVLQVVVHMVYFLHMNSRSEEGWTLISVIFTIVIVFIMLAGSIWVMYHLNTNMMPTMTEQMKVMP